MDGAQVSIRELKSRLSHYLRLTKAGQSVLIMERGQPIGRIVPVQRPVAERLAALTASGLAQWSGAPLPPPRPVARVGGGRSVADLLVEDREWSSTSTPAPWSSLG
ncbi:MAG: type II toxin-antitoxin system prevent-host-death family antitoxin [Candidatus Latescibacterota bacterium]